MQEMVDPCDGHQPGEAEAPEAQPQEPDPDAQDVHMGEEGNVAVERKPRADGPRAAPIPRDRPEEEANLPPGVLANYGFPTTTANPFVQIKLPSGMFYENKKSRCVSYVPDSEPGTARGTTRTKKMALNCVQSWAWSWWWTLSPDQRSAIHLAHQNRRTRSNSAKRQRTS